ncbi:MAG: D-glycero-beta-D-manno-heptose 1,7-bisphosphate 7-phosphatase [bacterium]|nr:D-glycero-beta-D-manno-heptose 1,7-bisphosphate 7-phosphatase [bacterium]
MSQPAIFIDRDGTLNVNVHHLRRAEDLQLIPGAGEAIARLQQAGYPVVIITNQSAIARGYITETDLADIHRELDRQLAAIGTQVDGVYYCPHHPEYGDKTICNCRKPAPGLLLQAAAERNLDLARSIMIGDNITDLQAGWNVGCHGALVLTGSGQQIRDQADSDTLHKIACIGKDLSEVSDWILHQAPDASGLAPS